LREFRQVVEIAKETHFDYKSPNHMWKPIHSLFGVSFGLGGSNNSGTGSGPSSASGSGSIFSSSSNIGLGFDSSVGLGGGSYMDF
jgi:hypothetical protein